MRLVLDEMHAPSVARALARECDIVAVADPGALRGMADEQLLAWAASEGRVMVTENIVDFASIAARWAVEGRDHAGLIFTNPKRFNRATVAYPGNLLAALRSLLEDRPQFGPSTIWWL